MLLTHSATHPPSLTQSFPPSVIHSLLSSGSLDVKSVEEMKGDQEFSSALTQYNSSANSGGEDIELLAFQTVTGENPFFLALNTSSHLSSSPR